MGITIKGGQVSFKPFIWVRKMSQTLGAYTQYKGPNNDPLAGDAVPYFLSRAIDAYLVAAMTYIRWERCREIGVDDIQQLAESSAIVTQLVDDIDSLLLSAVIRPTLELHVDLCILRRHLDDQEMLAGLCKALIHKHFVGDLELRLKACEEDYACRPSYFEIMLRGHRAEVSRTARKLSSKDMKILGSHKSKYADVHSKGSEMDRLALGPDSFSALAQLAYKLHFLPQKSMPLGPLGTSFLRNWCAWLLTAAGVRLTELARLPLPEELSTIEAAFEDFGGGDRLNSSCPTVGEGLLLSWGVALVTHVDVRPWGNEVLHLEYPLPFIEGLQSPDLIPRRFTSVRLEPSKMRDALDTVTSWFPGVPTSRIHEAARSTGRIQEIYDKFFASRIINS